MKALGALIWGIWFGCSFFFSVALSPRMGTGFFFGAMDPKALTGLGYQAMMAYFSFSLALALLAIAHIIVSWVLALAPLTRKWLFVSAFLALVAGIATLGLLPPLGAAARELENAVAGSSAWVENKSIFDAYGFLMQLTRFLLTIGTGWAFTVSVGFTHSSGSSAFQDYLQTRG